MVRSLLALPVLLLWLAPSARSQSVVWSDSFENGFADWHSLVDGWGCGEQIYGGAPCAGAWQPIDATHPCASWALPFPDGAQVAWFGESATCTYEGPGGDTASNHVMRKLTPIQLPSDAGNLSLRFLSKSEGESDSGYDVRSVKVSADGGGTWTAVGQVWNSDWFEASFDLTPWSGASILLEFKFDTYDTQDNAHHGWYVDAVRIESSSDAGTRFCAGDGSAAACPCGNFGAAGRGCATSFDPSGAGLSASGTASVSADTIVLHASGVSNSVVTFFQGTTQNAFGLGAAFGDGLRCAGGTVIRLKAALAAGNAVQFPAAGQPAVSAAGSVPPSGGARNYQVWYRNAASFCTPSTFNLTNGLQINWTP
jgi:hypothetical protein